MRNKNGFTLMELLVALFIGSMVTVALVSVWRAASIQTSQGQRQAIVRNNMSIFLRMFYKDLTEADIVLYPTGIGSITGVLLMSGYNIKRIGGDVAPGRASENELFENSVVRTYVLDSAKHRICLNENRSPFRAPFDESLTLDATTAAVLVSPISTFISNNSGVGTCNRVVMDNVNSAEVEVTPSNGTYQVKINIFRDFGGNAVPVNINFKRIFTAAGGA
jgi:prepilin-type N-terminal cleavage/methylation domain-containing protein